MKKLIKFLLSFILIIAITLNFAACNTNIGVTKIEAADLLDGIRADNVSEKPFDDAFITSYADFSLKLFKKSITENENSLISPLSVMLALAMTANGADGQTKTEMEELLGGKIKLDELNEYLHTYVKDMPSDDKYKLKISNSIWLKDAGNQFNVVEDFLQINANYYGAETYKSAFDSQTVKDINNWVNKKTDGMIDEILTEIEDSAVMYLINALVFDAEWEEVYNEVSVREGIFNDINGEKQAVKMMYSTEYRYIDTGKATGFVKNYKDAKYSFIALLPNEDVDINEYVESLDGDDFMLAVSNTESAIVSAKLPKFSFEYTKKMNEVLSSLGMPTAFDANLADFSKLGKSANGNLFIGNVLHKTYIAVDELGTKAGAVTKVDVNVTSAPNMEIKRVTLDRPFIYSIIDNRTNLPIFIGTVMDIE